MRIVIVGGVCVASDAISAAMLSQAGVLAKLPDVENVTVVTQFCDRSTTIDLVDVTDSWSLLRLPVVKNADLVIFHWGIAYALFDALPIVAATTSAVVHFHNVTPRHLVPVSERPTIERSLSQIQLIRMSDCMIWTESEFNATTLASWGVEPARVTFMPFPIEAPRPLLRGPRSGAVKLLTIGRLVPAKGVDVLISAFASALQELDVPVTLTLIGNASLSDLDFHDRLRAQICDYGLECVVRIVPDVDDAALWDFLERTDIVVSPSFHEGLCVPVIEAYIAGCRVVASDAGNLPFVVQAPDPVVRVGDVDALADALVELVREIAYQIPLRPPGADQLVEQFSTASVARHLCDALGFQAPG